MKFFYILFLTLLSSYTYSQDVDPSHCPCKGNENKENQATYCWPYYVPDDVIYDFYNSYSGDTILPAIIHFRQYFPIDIENSFVLCYGEQNSLPENLFLEVKNYIIPFLERNIENDIIYSTGLTISEDSKFIIPYCYGEDKLFIYKYNFIPGREDAFPELKGIEFYKKINIKEEIEAVKFFEKYLIVITKGKIIAFYSNGPKKMW